MICDTAVTASRMNVNIDDAWPNWLPVFWCDAAPEISATLAGHELRRSQQPSGYVRGLRKHKTSPSKRATETRPANAERPRNALVVVRRRPRLKIAANHVHSPSIQPENPAQDILGRRQLVGRVHAIGHGTEVGAGCEHRIELRGEDGNTNEREGEDEEVCEPVAPRPELREVVRVGLGVETTVDRAKGNDADDPKDYDDGALEVA